MSVLPQILVVSSSPTKPKSIIRLLTKDAPESGWKIDTKYYTALVDFVGLNSPCEPFNQELVEALLVHFDTNKSTGLDDLKEWDQVRESIQPEVKLLLANYCNEDTKITRNEALDWCSTRGFELVELYPSDGEKEQSEKCGVDRVLEALQAHTWSNLQRKSPTQPDTVQDDDDFLELFGRLHAMKAGLPDLPMAQRQHCAQQLVTAFWHAIGGDEDELLDV